MLFEAVPQSFLQQGERQLLGAIAPRILRKELNQARITTTDPLLREQLDRSERVMRASPRWHAC